MDGDRGIYYLVYFFYRFYNVYSLNFRPKKRCLQGIRYRKMKSNFFPSGSAKMSLREFEKIFGLVAGWFFCYLIDRGIYLEIFDSMPLTRICCILLKVGLFDELYLCPDYRLWILLAFISQISIYILLRFF